MDEKPKVLFSQILHFPMWEYVISFISSNQQGNISKN